MKYFLFIFALGSRVYFHQYQWLMVHMFCKVNKVRLNKMKKSCIQYLFIYLHLFNTTYLLEMCMYNIFYNDQLKKS